MISQAMFFDKQSEKLTEEKSLEDGKNIRVRTPKKVIRWKGELKGWESKDLK